MAFGGEMNNAVDVVFAYNRRNRLEVANVSAFERVVGCRFDILEIFEVAAISEFIEVYDVIVGIFVDEKSNNVRTDKPGPSGDNDTAFCQYC